MDILTRLGRALLGGVLAFMALDNFSNRETRVKYADAKDVPEAEILVPFASGMLLFGGIGVALKRFPRAAPGAAATFLLCVTPMMHDFWNIDDEGEKQTQQVHFLKNGALLGGMLFLLAHSEED
jgi:putative oxidoreductase